MLIQRILTLVLFVSATSINLAAADMVPAIKYSGKILSGNEITNRSCEFYIAINPLGSAQNSEYALIYAAGVHGEVLPPGLADFYYFNAAAALGSNFYGVDQSQEQNSLTMTSIALRPISPKFGTEVSPNDLAALNQNSDIETSMILSFAPGISHQQVTTALNGLADLASNPAAPADLSVLNAVEIMTVLLWHAGHYDRARCGDVYFDSVAMIDVDFPDASPSSPGETSHDHHDGHEH